MQRQERVGLWVVLIACLLTRLTPPFAINHDGGWFLHAADRVLSGENLYRDVVDVNPPLAIYLAMAVVGFASLFGMSAVLVFDLFVLGIVALSLALAVVAARRTGLPGFAENEFLIVALLAVVFVVVPGVDFGQREHLLCALSLPWFVVVAGRLGGCVVGRRLGWTIGLLAGLGMALKPYFLLAPLLVRIGTAFRQRELVQVRRPENEGLVVALVLYGAHFFVVPFREDFVATVQVVMEEYGKFAISTVDMLLRWSTQRALIVGLILLIAIRVGRRFRATALSDASPASDTVFPLAWAGMLAAALWQSKGFRYHLTPALLIGAAGVVFALAPVVGVISRLRQLCIAILIAALMLTLGRHWLAKSTDGGLMFEPTFTGVPEHFSAVKDLSAGQSIVVLDSNIHTFFAYLQGRRIGWASRYACLWPLPGPPGSERLRGHILADIDRYKPALIYVRVGTLSHVEDASFDLLGWLRDDLVSGRGYSAPERCGDFGVMLRRGD